MLTIDYCGHHIQNADYDRIYRPSGTASCLFLLILSPMTFHLPDRPAQKVQPGACIIYPGGACHDYQADKEFFNSYIHFFCSDEELAGYGIRLCEIFYPQQTDTLNALVKRLHLESLNQPLKSAEMIDLYLRQLLILIHRAQQEAVLLGGHKRNYYPELAKLRESMLEQCEKPWTVEQMCREINIGKSQFYHYYEYYFHQSPKEELLKARLQKARYYISNEAMTIKQAAYASGFENICHFNRYFKKQFGCTPTEFKNKVY